MVEKLVIIGSGPAGWTAALYAARAELKPVVIEGREPGGQLMGTTDVENFPGFPEGVLGPELMEIMKKQATRFGTRVVSDFVESVDFSVYPFKLKTTSNGELEAESVIIATGASAKWLNVPGEDKLKGRGVSACATCDGFFFKEKEIAVVGGGDAAMEEANFLTRFASKVHVFVRSDVLRASKIMQERTMKNPKINFMWNSEVKEVIGEDKVTGLKVFNNKTNETLEQIAQALFKSWFVDFDPVNAKAKGDDVGIIGQDLGISKEILKLFPDEFEESELGLIPKGWELKPLYETAEYINGSAFKATDFSDNKDGLPIIKIVELKQGIIEGTQFTLNEVPSKYLIDSGDVLYSWSGSPETSLDVFKWHGGKGWLNQHIFKLNFDTVQQRNFTYFLLKQIKPLLISTAKQKQTTGLGHITIADMKRIKIIYPSSSVLDKFSEKISPIYEKSSRLIEQNHALIQLRDTLLPKLLLGEITKDTAAKDKEVFQ